MDFALTEEQQLLKDSIARFVERDYRFEQRRALARAGGFSADHWAHFAQMGWLMTAVPEGLGGIGGGAVEQGIVAEAFGSAMVLEPFVHVAVIARQALLDAGGAHAEALLPALCTGAARPVLAHGEDGAFGETAWVETRAERSGDGWVLSGGKSVVHAAPFATHFLVSARTGGAAADEAGISLFVVPADAPGLSRRDMRLSDNSRAADLTLDRLALPAGALLGTEGKGHAIIGAALAHGIVALGGEAVGAMNATLWMTRDYLNTRVQFGKPIGTFQALQHRMADMLIEVEMTRSQVYRAMAHLDAAPAVRDRAVSSLKVQIARSAKYVGGNAIQLHGGIGITEEYAVGHYFKRLTMIDNMFGNAGTHLDRMVALNAAA